MGVIDSHRRPLELTEIEKRLQALEVNYKEDLINGFGCPDIGA